MKQNTPLPRKQTQCAAPRLVKPKRTLTEAQQARLYRFQTAVGYGIVGLSVIGAIVLCLMGQLPAPVAVGVSLLALFRFFALKRELKRQEMEQA